MRLACTLAGLLTFAVAMGNDESPDSVYQLPDTIVVTAERFATPINKISWPARTLGAHQLRHRTTLSNALDGLGGIDLAGYGQTGHLSNIFIWGSPSSQVLLLYDGRPVYNYATGGFNLADYSASELSRVEIVKGTQSALYGSDAIGGVVNLIPRFDYLDRAGADVRIGSFNYLGYNLSAAKNLSRWHLNADFGRETTDNSRPNSGIERETITLKSIWLPRRADIELSLGFRLFHDSLGLPGPMPAAGIAPFYGSDESESLVNFQKDRNYSFDARLKINHDINSGLQAQFDLFHEKRKLDYFGRYAYVYGDSIDVIDRNTSLNRSFGLSGRMRWQREKFSLSAGLEYLSGSANLNTRTITTTFTDFEVLEDESATARNHHRDTYAFWSGGEYYLTSWSATELSTRSESVNGDKIRQSWNTGLKFFPIDLLTLKAAYGTAYRLPAINDLYWPIDFYSEGNPDLTPEKGKNLVLSATCRPGPATTFSADYFYREVDHLISWEPVGTPNDYGVPRWTPSNLNRFRVSGIDLAIAMSPLKSLNLDWDLSLQRARQIKEELIYSGIDGTQRFEKTERRAAFVPEIKWRLGLDFTAGNWDAGLNLIYTASRRAYFASYYYDIMYNAIIGYVEKRIPAGYVTDLAVGYRLPLGSRILLKINDLFDSKKPRQFGTLGDRDYPSSGRNMILQINFGIDKKN